MTSQSPAQARPRTPEEIGSLPACPEVAEEAKLRRISQIVHFTTLSGALGVLASNAVKSRTRLPQDKYLQYVYKPNSEIRKDSAWLDYVNLSVERINDWMFGSSEYWHTGEDNPWVVLSFRPEILAHPGVVFTTTNNIYPACRRGEGLLGFNQLFADVVLGRYGERHERTDKLPPWPTDRQAEVLYPVELSCDYLQRINVQLEESIDSIHGILAGLGKDTEVPICFAPEVFQ